MAARLGAASLTVSFARADFTSLLEVLRAGSKGSSSGTVRRLSRFFDDPGATTSGYRLGCPNVLWKSDIVVCTRAYPAMSLERLSVFQKRIAISIQVEQQNSDQHPVIQSRSNYTPLTRKSLRCDKAFWRAPDRQSRWTMARCTSRCRAVRWGRKNRRRE